MARTLERMSYYGLRGIIFLYLIKGGFGFSDESAHTLYSLFVSSIVFSQVIGAVLGDLLLGNKKALITGGILQLAGTLLLCVPDKIALYSGLISITLGSGLFSPNLFSAYCKKYLGKPELMDSGLSIIYTVVNIGAFIGAFFISLTGYSHFVSGFAICAFLMLAALAVSFFIEKQEPEEIPVTTHKSPNISVPYVLGTLLLSGIFWFIVDYANSGILYLETNFSGNSGHGANILWSSFNVLFITIAGVVACITWSFFDYSKLLKVIVGFFMAVVAYGVLLVIPAAPSQIAVIVLMVSALIFSIAEIHIGPVFYAIIAKYSNPKYLTIMISLSFIPYRLFIYIAGFFNYETQEAMPLIISALALAVVGISLLAFAFIKNKGISENVSLEETA